jgi:hypothetical protein
MSLLSIISFIVCHAGDVVSLIEEIRKCVADMSHSDKKSAIKAVKNSVSGTVGSPPSLVKE